MDYKSYFYSYLIYVFTFLLSCGCVYIAEKKGVFHNLFRLLAIVIPSITATYRESGIDLNTYKIIYNHLRAGNDYNIEFSWKLLNRLSPSFEILLFITAIIFLGAAYVAICNFIKKDRTLAWFIFLMVCYSAFLNIMRQMIAVTIVFAGISFYYHKKSLNFLLCILLASTFHTSALFMIIIPAYWIFIKKIRSQEWVILLLSLIFSLGTPLLLKIVEYIGVYTGYASSLGESLSLGFLVYALPPLFFYYTQKRMLGNNNYVIYCLSLYLLMIPFQFLGMQMRAADRIMLYFQIMIVILVPLIIQAYDQKFKKHYLRSVYVVWFIFHYVILNIVLSGNGAYPYRIF